MAFSTIAVDASALGHAVSAGVSASIDAAEGTVGAGWSSAHTLNGERGFEFIKIRPTPSKPDQHHPNHVWNKLS